MIEHNNRQMEQFMLHLEHRVGDLTAGTEEMSMPNWHNVPLQQVAYLHAIMIQ